MSLNPTLFAWKRFLRRYSWELFGFWRRLFWVSMLKSTSRTYFVVQHWCNHMPAGRRWKRSILTLRARRTCPQKRCRWRRRSRGFRTRERRRRWRRRYWCWWGSILGNDTDYSKKEHCFNAVYTIGDTMFVGIYSVKNRKLRNRKFPLWHEVRNNITQWSLYLSV